MFTEKNLFFKLYQSSNNMYVYKETIHIFLSRIREGFVYAERKKIEGELGDSTNVDLLTM